MGLSQGTQFRLSAFEPHDDLVVGIVFVLGTLGFRLVGV